MRGAKLRYTIGMVENKTEDVVHVSVPRLRIGVILFVIWWLPLYLLVPTISALASGSGYSTRNIFIAVIVAQSVIGLLGLALVGKQAAVVLKKVKPKQMPKVMWHVFWSGQVTTE